MNNLNQRGLTGARLELVCVDGGKGALATLPLVYPHLPVQRCCAHKIRNIVGKCRKADGPAVKRGPHKIMNAPGLAQARAAARRFAQRWEALYPKAIACLRADLDPLLHFYRFEPSWHSRVRTTNAIERQFVEVRRRRTRPMGVFFDSTSLVRILFAVFTNQNENQGTCTFFPLIQTN